MDVDGFRWILWTPGVESLATCGSLWDAPKGRLQAPILQVRRLGGSDPEGVQAWRLGGLDWIALIARLEVARWGSYWWDGKV